MGGITVVKPQGRTGLIAWDEDDGSQSIYTLDAKPLTRQEFTDLCRQVSRWYDTHTDEEIQELCDAADARRKEEEAQWSAPSPRTKKTPKPGVVYLLKCGEHYKIGKSIDYPVRKIQLDTQFAYPTELIHTIRSTNPELLEQQLHLRYKRKRLNGEWFDLSAEDVDALKTL